MLLHHSSNTGFCLLLRGVSGLSFHVLSHDLLISITKKSIFTLLQILLSFDFQLLTSFAISFKLEKLIRNIKNLVTRLITITFDQKKWLLRKPCLRKKNLIFRKNVKRMVMVIRNYCKFFRPFRMNSGKLYQSKYTLKKMDYFHIEPP